MFAFLLGCSSGFSGSGGVFGGLSAALLDGDKAGVNIVPAALKLVESSVGVDDELLEQCLHVGGIGAVVLLLAMDTCSLDTRCDGTIFVGGGLCRL
jgi:hypothetical protein